MLGPLWQRRQKIVRAIARKFTKRDSAESLPNTWWDDVFYGREISDAKTISRSTSQIAALVHYRSVEKAITRHLEKHPVDVLDSVLDVGTGAGHWINFYKDLGATHCMGVDVSSKCAAALKSKYRNDATVEIRQGLASEVISNLNVQFSVVNAIGVMFHIVNDDEWNHCIRKISQAIRSDGVLIVSGHFGLFNNLNVQVNKKCHVNKRLRSRSCWRKQLRASGFHSIRFYRNFSYLSIREEIPENNVMVATK